MNRPELPRIGQAQKPRFSPLAILGEEAAKALASLPVLMLCAWMAHRHLPGLSFGDGFALALAVVLLVRIAVRMERR